MHYRHILSSRPFQSTRCRYVRNHSNTPTHNPEKEYTQKLSDHAVAILSRHSWRWPNVLDVRPSGNDGQYAVTSRLLSCAIQESTKFPGSQGPDSLLNKFWKSLGKCHPEVKKRLSKIEANPEISQSECTAEMLMDGLPIGDIDLKPVLQLARETVDLVLAVMIPTLIKRGIDDLCIRKMNFNYFYRLRPNLIGLWEYPRLTFKAHDRDGKRCLFTDVQFNTKLLPGGIDGTPPILTHIIPNLSYTNPMILAALRMLFGWHPEKRIGTLLGGIQNVVNMEYRAHLGFRYFLCGIEATEQDGTIVYTYRRVRTLSPFADHGSGLLIEELRDGDRIFFGRGPEGKRLGTGPHPLLCNLHLAMARIAHMSGVASMVHRGINHSFQKY